VLTELSIDRLTLRIANAAGHEHRVHTITTRAAALIGEELVALGRTLPADRSRHIPSLQPGPIGVDLTRTDDETCARLLAASVIDAVRLRVEG
jgi:hypothetical protein